MKRRDFILSCILGPLGVYILRGCGEAGKTVTRMIYPPSFEPSTEEEKIMEAFADTVIPGSASDPDGSPGALEAGAMLVMYDKSYPMHRFASLVSTLLDKKAKGTYGKEFYRLDLDERTSVLASVVDQVPYFSLLIKLVKGVFYAALVNDVGYRYMGYPGPNLGYAGNGFSFSRKMCGEMTDDGSLP